VTDRIGQEVKMGDIVAYGVREYDSGGLHLAMVLEATDPPKKQKTGGYSYRDNLGSIYILLPALTPERVELIDSLYTPESLAQHFPEFTDIFKRGNVLYAKDTSRTEFSVKKSKLSYNNRCVVIDLPPEKADESSEIKALRMGREKVLNGDIRRKRR